MDDQRDPNDASEFLSAPDGYGIYPYSGFRRFWDHLMYFCSLLVLWELPFEWLFDLDLRFSWFAFSLVLDGLFLADVIIVQRTGVLHYGVINLRQEIILNDIPRWRLVAYWVSPFPFYLIGHIVGSLFVFRILITFKLLRLFRWFDANRTIRKTLVYHSTVSSVGLLAVDLFTIIHIFSCIFWFAGQNEALSSSWIAFEDARESQIVQYLHAMYFVTTCVLTVGYGDIHPISFVEVCLMICIEILGVFFYSFVCSVMVSIVANPLRNSFLSRYERLYSAFKWRGVSDDTLRELIRYQEYAWERDRGGDDFYETSQRMPEPLQRRVAMSLHADHFKKLKAFRDCDEETLEKVALALRSRIFTPGDFLTKAGRVSQKMFIITEGRIELLSADGSLIAAMDGQDADIVIGQASVIKNQQEAVSVIAQTYLAAFELPKEAADEIDLKSCYRFVRGDADPPGDGSDLEEFSEVSR